MTSTSIRALKNGSPGVHWLASTFTTPIPSSWIFWVNLALNIKCGIEARTTRVVDPFVRLVSVLSTDRGDHTDQLAPGADGESEAAGGSGGRIGNLEDRHHAELPQRSEPRYDGETRASPSRLIYVFFIYIYIRLTCSHSSSRCF